MALSDSSPPNIKKPGSLLALDAGLKVWDEYRLLAFEVLLH